MLNSYPKLRLMLVKSTIFHQVARLTGFVSIITIAAQIMNKMKLLLTILLMFGTAQLLAGNHESIEISDVVMPKVPSVSPTAAIYLTITNTGKSKVALLDASTNVAHHTMIHQSKVENGVAKMKHVDKLEIESGKSLKFVPGGYHIMLMGIDKGLITKPFEVHLTFEQDIKESFTVTP
ncbi:copper chaperone PCu(A)C [Aliikangiella coralliicola]|uniref:Copper chaperone PCu(A)C n=1 Tax=Aliikangiella coralliicola TaxID=2592383 RepID=A0A545TW64_9GAMM|nr:copper chaperone PCu(A)C [Aliikangiella coralliicola]TQV81459.1 copper chaperone PCu(A)C [Aliikangiella coralliicola]